MLDLSLSEEQEQLVHAYRALFQRECGAQAVRDAEPLGHTPELWKRVLDLGAADMAVPEAAGGAGAELLDAALVAELVGEFLAPVPLVETTVANRLLARGGTEEASEVLTRALGAGAVTTLALHAPVDGRAAWVPAGAVADTVLVAAGPQVLALADSAPEAALPNLGSLPLAHRDLNGARVLAEGDGAQEAAAVARDEWRVLTAAVLTGAGAAALELARGYTTERKAWGVPIASYQSVAHRMADLATALSGARLLVRKAAWAADHDPARARLLALQAFSFAAETAEAAATDALHFHGGYGFMLEYDVQLYFRRIKAWSLLNGDPRRDLERAADELWGPPGAHADPAVTSPPSRQSH